MKNAFIMIGLIGFVSCGQVNNNAEIKSLDTTKVMTTLSTDKLETINLAKTVFEKGAARHFTDSCTFLFECDCCSGKLILNADSTFYEIGYCESNVGVVLGHYRVSGSSLTLAYSGLNVSTEYNEAHEENSSLPEYFEKDTVLSAIEYKYNISSCNHNTKLTSEDKKEIAILTKEPYMQAIAELEKRNYIKRLEKLK